MRSVCVVVVLATAVCGLRFPRATTACFAAKEAPPAKNPFWRKWISEEKETEWKRKVLTEEQEENVVKKWKIIRQLTRKEDSDDLGIGMTEVIIFFGIILMMLPGGYRPYNGFGRAI
mmetsp:Transcript_26836/g.86877  ORF Transcript_26836/g.86877 Transcript_26836/m.86877 type:complete len:117 (+) Transcript_26836:92-442(+)